MLITSFSSIVNYSWKYNDRARRALKIYSICKQNTCNLPMPACVFYFFNYPLNGVYLKIYVLQNQMPLNEGSKYWLIKRHICVYVTLKF